MSAAGLSAASGGGERLAWLFRLLFVAAALHVGEEFFFPGGFLGWANEAFAGGTMTPDLAVAVNAVFLALMLAATLVGPRSLAFSLGMATIVIINGGLHLVGTIVTSSYSPGVLTGTLLYLPLGTSAFVLARRSGRLAPATALRAIALGAALHAVPLAILAIRRAGLA